MKQVTMRGINRAQRFLRLTFVASSLFLLPGCGPFAIGGGFAELLKDETSPDTVLPKVAVERRDVQGGGSVPNTTRFSNSDASEFVITANKQGLRIEATITRLGGNPIQPDLSAFPIIEFVHPADDTYTLTVRVRDAGDEDMDEATDTWTVDRGAPNAPEGFRVESPTQRSLSLRWEPTEDNTGGSGIEKYMLHYSRQNFDPLGEGRGATVGGFLADSAADVGNRIRVLLEDLEGNKLYEFKVSAVDAAGNEGPQSVPVVGRTQGGGTGAFKKVVDLPVVGAINPLAVVSGDFNNDGLADLAIADAAGQRIVILLRQGTNPMGEGTFVTGTPLLVNEAPPVGGVPYFLKAVHVDVDGMLDLVVVLKGTGTIRVFRGGGDGTFVEAAPGAATLGLDAVQPIVTGDLNDDAMIDIAGLGSEASDIELRFAQGNDAEWNGGFSNDGTTAVQGLEAFALETGDFNGDGIADLVVSNRESPEVSLVLGSRTPEGRADEGEYQAPALFSFGDTVGPMLAADFNGDGITDVAGITQGDAGTLRVALGEGSKGVGSGVLGVPKVLPSGREPRALLTGDFNSDGLPDLAVGSVASSDVAVYLSMPPGSTDLFEAPAFFPLQPGATSLATGDFNSDGVLDLVSVNATPGTASPPAEGPVKIAYGIGGAGAGTGAFSPGQVVSLSQVPADLGLANLNGDSALDLVVLANTANDEPYLNPLLGTAENGRANGFFNLGISRPFRIDFQEDESSEDAKPGCALALGDFNNDRIVDVAVGLGPTAGGLAVLRGMGADGIGDGRFEDPSEVLVTDTGCVALRTSDLNRDGNLDLVLARDTENADFALGEETGAGHSAGTFRPTDTVADGTELDGRALGGLDIADFNGDGIEDLVVTAAANATFPAGSVIVYLGSGGGGQGSGDFDPPSFLGGTVTPGDIRVIDFNSDGRPDLVVADPSNSRILILLNLGDVGDDGDIDFSAPALVSVGSAPVQIAAGDFNGDRITDLAVANSGSGTVSLLRGGGTGGRGDGTFSSSGLVSVGGSPRRVVVGDFNADLVPDLAVATRGPNAVSIFLGIGNE